MVLGDIKNLLIFKFANGAVVMFFKESLSVRCILNTYGQNDIKSGIFLNIIPGGSGQMK